MLSRVANALYWMSRYLERAENSARFLSVTHGYAQEMRGISRQAADECWAVARRMFAQEQSEGGMESFRRLAFDHSLDNSLVNCLTRARENARGIRDAISSELWEELNTLYLYVSQEANDRPTEASELSLLHRVRTTSHVIQGLRDNTLRHTDEWHFMLLGQSVERADQTARLLSAMFSHPVLAAADAAGHNIDTLHLVATLRSCTALETFSRAGHALSAENVAAFLLLDNYFPRSVEFSAQQVVHSLHALSGTSLEQYGNEAEQVAGRLLSELRFADINEILEMGLKGYVDSVAGKIGQIGLAIRRVYFEI
ncbi:MAG: alpha-E domain-containing protein [Armatimonadota bacterium]